MIATEDTGAIGIVIATTGTGGIAVVFPTTPRITATPFTTLTTFSCSNRCNSGPRNKLRRLEVIP